MVSPKLISAKPAGDYRIYLSFSDGLQAEIDLSGELSGGIFDALKDPVFFNSFVLKPLFGTIEWSNGADFSPEFLYKTAKSTQQRNGADS